MRKVAEAFKRIRESVLVLLRESGRFIMRKQVRRPPSLKIIALLFLASAGHAQELPYALPSTAQNETAEYLLEQAKKDRWTTVDNSFGGTQTFENVTITGALSGAGAGVETSTRSNRMTGVDWGSVGLICKSTLTVTATQIKIYSSIKIVGSGVGNGNAGFLVNGACPSGYTCSASCASNVNPWETTNDTNHSLTITDFHSGSSASYAICIWACSDAGTDASGSASFRLDYK